MRVSMPDNKDISEEINYFCDDEWSPLEEVIVGRAEHSCFPSEPMKVLSNIMPRYYLDEFKPNNPFPPEIVQKADEELNLYARTLESFGVKVRRPEKVDWLKHGGYTGSMMRDGLMVIGNTIFESAFSWKCRRNEIELLHGSMLHDFEVNNTYHVVRAPTPPEPDRIFDIEAGDPWAINNSRPAFDCADFARCGKYVITRLCNTTNQKGIDFVQAHLPPGYEMVVFEVKNPKEMHIDDTFVPLMEGTALYNPQYVDLEELRKHKPLDTWRLLPPPSHPHMQKYPPLYMASEWEAINVLVLDEKHVFCEKDDHMMQNFFRSLGMVPVPLPFKHVYSLGGSFHCATVDLRRTKVSGLIREW